VLPLITLALSASREKGSMEKKRIPEEPQSQTPKGINFLVIHEDYLDGPIRFMGEKSHENVH